MDFKMQMVLAVVLVFVALAVILGLDRCFRGESESLEVTPKSWEPEPEPNLREIEELLRPVCEPALLLRKTFKETSSHFGGVPPAYAGFVWPRRKGVSLSFLARIDLAANGENLPWLPKKGSLLFFYDLDEMPGSGENGFGDSWAVLYLEDNSLGTGPAVEPEDSPDGRSMPHAFLQSIPALLPPSARDPVLDFLQLDEEESDAIYDYKNSLYEDHPRHQMGGYCNPVQNAGMELDCEAAFRGVDRPYPGDAETPQTKALRASASDWKLLLQIDSDDDLQIMWGDVGCLYFWVRQQDSIRKDFSKVCVIMQCH